MKYSNTRWGFTLIELLVVVLIIGILAAVALPQYQKTVDKSRYSTMMPIIQAINKAQQTYYLANGKYTCNKQNLDIEAPNNLPSFMTVEISTGYTVGFYLSNEKEIIAVYGIYYPESTLTKLHNKTVCFAPINQYNSRGKALCESMGAVPMNYTVGGGSVNYNVYEFK